MRHRKKFNHLGRKAPHRKAMLANMASSLILHKRITTTTAKAKALRSYVEPVISRSKEDSTHSRRMAFRTLRDKFAVSELFRDVAAKVGERPGGYTRIIKLGNRLGDNADMCIIELVDYNETLLAEKSAAKPKTTRRRRGGKKKTEEIEGTVVAESDDTAVEAVESTEEETVTETEDSVEELVEEAAEEVAEEVVEEVAEEAAEELVEEETETKTEVKAEAEVEEEETVPEAKEKKKEE